MRSWVTLGFGAVICVNSLLAADPRWVRLASPNFELYTTASERSARDTLRYFEQVRSFFAQATGHSPAKQAPVRIVVFNSAKEYEPYRPNDFAVAFYQGTADRDCIVMGHAGAEAFPTAIHEYTHLVVQHAKLNFPPWLNEGLAEFYSTLRPTGDKILVGSLIPGRLQAIVTDKWVPLATILAADQNSPYYNEKDKAGNLYNEGWALTHMLALNPAYQPRFKQVMQAISDGIPSATALEQAYGKPLRKIESELIDYLRSDHFQGFLVPARLEKGDELKPEPAEKFEVALLLAEVGDRPGREASARVTFDGLIAQDPKRPEPYADLGYLEWRQNHQNEARDQFAKAFDLGSRNPRLLWDYGRMAEGSDVSKSVEVLAALMQLEPDRQDVRIELASMQLRVHAAKDALQTLVPVQKVSPDVAPRVLNLLAYANLEVGDRVKARSAAEQLKKLATDIEDRDRADRILKYLDGPQPPAPPASIAATESVSPPAFQSREAPPAPARPSFIGKFAELQCEAQAKMILETTEGKKVLLIDDPTKLLVNGKSGETMELTCGPQKKVPVRIDYDPADGNRKGIDGVVRVIHFEP